MCARACLFCSDGVGCSGSCPPIDTIWFLVANTLHRARERWCARALVISREFSGCEALAELLREDVTLRHLELQLCGSPPPPTPPLPYVPSIPLPTPANLQPTSRQLYGGVRVITGADLPCTSARKCSSVAEVGWRVLCACAEEQCLTLHWSLRGRRLTDSNMEVVSAAAAGRSVGLATLNLAGNELTDQSAATLAALQRR